MIEKRNAPLSYPLSKRSAGFGINSAIQLTLHSERVSRGFIYGESASPKLLCNFGGRDFSVFCFAKNGEGEIRTLGPFQVTRSPGARAKPATRPLQNLSLSELLLYRHIPASSTVLLFFIFSVTIAHYA